MIDVEASHQYGAPVTEPNGRSLHINQLTPEENDYEHFHHHETVAL